jgi:hypothetical protein
MNNGAPIQPPGMPARSMGPDRFVQASLLRTQAQRGLSSLQRHWWIPLASLLVFGLPAVVYSVLAPSTFRSQAVLWVGERL